LRPLQMRSCTPIRSDAKRLPQLIHSTRLAFAACHCASCSSSLKNTIITQHHSLCTPLPIRSLVLNVGPLQLNNHCTLNNWYRVQKVFSFYRPLATKHSISIVQTVFVTRLLANHAETCTSWRTAMHSHGLFSDVIFYMSSEIIPRIRIAAHKTRLCTPFKRLYVFVNEHHGFKQLCLHCEIRTQKGNTKSHYIKQFTAKLAEVLNSQTALQPQALSKLLQNRLRTASSLWYSHRREFPVSSVEVCVRSAEVGCSAPPTSADTGARESAATRP
jgi:hypothetical protein